MSLLLNTQNDFQEFLINNGQPTEGNLAIVLDQVVNRRQFASIQEKLLLNRIIRLNVEAMHSELEELKNHINWKPWSEVFKPIDVDEIMFECADIFCFLANIVNSCSVITRNGNCPDTYFFKYVYAKQRENIDRQTGKSPHSKEYKENVLE